jgi:3-hydroxypropanoate dehydrogenase
MATIDQSALDVLFHNARSQNGWKSDPVDDRLLQEAYEIAKWGPTSMNTQPMRLVFLKTEEGKKRLQPALAPGNVDKTMTAPVIAIVAHDMEFYNHLPRIFPHNPNAQAFFAGKEGLINDTAVRNGTLQGAYFLLALRAVGLDAGPMSGFDAAKVNAEFFEGTTFKTNFIMGIGYGDPEKVFNRSPRLSLEEISTIY